jgi:hypothetical protein
MRVPMLQSKRLFISSPLSLNASINCPKRNNEDSTAPPTSHNTLICQFVQSISEFARDMGDESRVTWVGFQKTPVSCDGCERG